MLAESASFPDWIVAATAICALAFGIIQVRSNERLAGDAAALSAWRDYMNACLQYPEFTSDALVRTVLPSKTTDGIVDQLSVASERYLWFLSLLLNSCEQVLLNASGAKEWRDTLADQIAFHWPAAEQVRAVWSTHYDEAMLALIDEGIRRGRANG